MKKMLRKISIIIGVITLIVSSTAPTVHADDTPQYTPNPVDCSAAAIQAREATYISYGFGYYDPCSTDCPSAPSTATVTQLSGSDNEQKIYNFWVAQGLSPAQAAGITGSLEGESGFSAFRQQDDPNTGKPMPWPTGGYGIAQFDSSGQRAAVTSQLSTSLGDTFTTYYVPAYGGAVTAATGYIPAGIPDGSNGTKDVNGAFLLVELNYLLSYISSSMPATAHPERATSLTADYNITIQKDQKLLPFIETLTSPDAVAQAWTYLYEDPASPKVTSATRAGYAEAILTKESSGSQTATDCSSIGTGGLSFDQADQLMVDYEKNAASWFLAHGYGDKSGTAQYQYGPSTGEQCTVLVTYFEDRFSKPLSAIYGGTDMANSIVSHSGGVYTSGTSKSIKPYSIISFTPAHTSVILGINADGSIIVDEMWKGAGKGTPFPGSEKMTEHDNGSAIGRVEQWSSIDTYISHHGTVTGIAVPSDTEITHINTQLSQFFGGGSQ